MAHSTRPQLASAPKMAAFIRLEEYEEEYEDDESDEYEEDTEYAAEESVSPETVEVPMEDAGAADAVSEEPAREAELSEEAAAETEAEPPEEDAAETEAELPAFHIQITSCHLPSL